MLFLGFVSLCLAINIYWIYKWIIKKYFYSISKILLDLFTRYHTSNESFPLCPLYPILSLRIHHNFRDLTMISENVSQPECTYIYK